MTIAYVVQVNLLSGIKYIGQAGKLSIVPKFFLSAPAVRRYLQNTNHNGYDVKKHKELTKVIIIKDIDKGMKDSNAEILFYYEFMDLGPAAASRMRSNPNAFYKIKLADGSFERSGPGSKHGRMWTEAGQVRSHISCSYHNPLFGRMKGAEVIEYEWDKTLENIQAVRRYDIVSFYIASPSSRQRYERAQAQAQRAMARPPVVRPALV